MSQRLREHVSVVEALRSRPVAGGPEQNGALQAAPVDEDDLPVALLACLEMIENNAQRGATAGGLTKGEECARLDALSRAMLLVRQCLFSNWMQVQERERGEGLALAPAPYYQVARSLDGRVRDQAQEVDVLRKDLRAAKAEVERLRQAIIRNDAAVQEARNIREELDAVEAKNAHYIQRLRRDLLSQFEDLKAMEASRDATNALAKQRSLALADVERKLASQEEVARLADLKADQYLERLKMLEAQTGGLQNEAKELRRQVLELEREKKEAAAAGGGKAGGGGGKAGFLAADRRGSFIPRTAAARQLAIPPKAAPAPGGKSVIIPR